MPIACLTEINFRDLSSKNMDMYMRKIPHGIAEYPKISAILSKRIDCVVRNGELTTISPPTKSMVPKRILLSLLLIVNCSFFFLRGMYEYIIGYYRGIFKGEYFFVCKASFKYHKTVDLLV